mgnify:FL=1
MNVASLDPYQTLEMMTFLDFPPMLIYGWIVTEMSAITSLKLSLALLNKAVDDSRVEVFFSSTSSLVTLKSEATLKLPCYKRLLQS